MKMNRLRYHLRTRLLLTYGLLIFVGLGSFSLWVGQQFAQSSFADYANGLQLDALLIASALVEPIEESSDNLPVVIGIVDRYRQQLKGRITLLDATGRPWLDSDGLLPTGDLRADREIVGAFNNQPTYDLRLDEKGAEMIYTAAPVLYESQAIGYVRLAVPASVPNGVIRERWLQLLGGFLLVLLLTTIVSLFVAGRLSRPLIELEERALKIAEGDFSQRVMQLGSDEIGAVGQAFNHMAAQVEMILAEQKSFAGNAAHELRTPLTTIRLRTEALQEGGVDPETAERYIQEIDQEADRLGRLVDDLSLLARLDSTRFKRGEELVDLTRLIRLVVQEMEPAAKKKGIELLIEKSGVLPDLPANPNHLRVVVRNLLENGIKYTASEGMVQIETALVGREVSIVISDNGQGIAAAELPHLHKRFYRVDKGRSREVDGAGLGLALVYSIVAGYEGRFEMSSLGVGKGTTAVVWWPIVG